MCKEDIRLARAASAKNRYRWNGVTAVGNLPPPDPNRYSIVASMYWSDGTLSDLAVDVYTVIGGIRVSLCVLTHDEPSRVLTLHEYGQAIMGEINYAVVAQDQPDAITLIDMGFLSSLGDI